MTSSNNSGTSSSTVADLMAQIKSSGKVFLPVNEDTEEHSEEYAHFHFIGNYEGKEVVYDAVMYTLRLQHESELFEIAEHRAAKHFPQYKKITYEEDENGNLKALDDLEEEIGLFMAEVIMELEEEEAIKVKEHVDIDDHLDSGIGLDIGLNVESITPKVIEKFIKEFNQDTLQLDETLYTFQTHHDQIAN
jgi:hypothetical protein